MQKYLSEARQLLALAIPVILAQVAQTSMSFVDTVMAGAVSATDMAAVAVGPQSGCLLFFLAMVYYWP